jgi:hypothetical protein
MMTRTTLKALWVGGGGILATWLAVSPNQGVPAMTSSTEGQRPAAASAATAAQLNTQATRLRERTAAVTLRPSTRNPFRYRPKSAARTPAPHDQTVLPSSAAPAMPAIPTGPILKLSGVAQNDGKRTAIISGDGQIYLVGEGDSVAGRYIVVKVDSEAVVLRDASGAEQRLILPQ